VTMPVLPGEPALLTTRAARLTTSAEVIISVARDMRGIVNDDEGEAVQALRDVNERIAADLERIHPRYDGTASAVTEYAVALTTAHETAERAQSDLDDALAEQTRAGDALDSLSDRIDEASDPAPTLTDRLPGARQDVEAADAAVDAARARIERAREDMEDAAEAAIRRIDDAIDATNEDVWDRIGDVFSDIGDWLAGIGEWIADFLADVVALLKRILATIVAALGVLLVLLLLFAVGAFLFGTIVASIIVGVFAGFLLASILSDVLSPTPTVSATDPYGKSLRRPDPPTMETVLDGTSEVDSLGGEDETIVRITKVLGPDGWQYTVTLPSTQEWLSRFGDEGAVNDLDSNLALMLTPALQTQYERAVLEAMAQEGIGPDDPVLLVGFSQGGIMAGHLAAYNTDYNWEGVIASGAPIDHMPIPDSVDVVSVQHNGDPVPNLDIVTGDLGTEQGPNWTSIRVDPPNPNPVLGVDVGAHNSELYSGTYQDHIAEIEAAHPDLAHFFNDDGYTDVSYYEWSE
jgi:hypothetical protein